jgi:type IV secretory pathway component VirB8
MGHVSNWFHDHHWNAEKNQKTDWRFFLLIALVAVASFVLIILMFPVSMY